MQAQEIVAPADSLAQTDSLLVAPTDSTTLAGDSIPEKQTGLDAPVSYQATDSIVMTAGNWAYLYGEGDVKYQNIELILLNCTDDTQAFTFCESGMKCDMEIPAHSIQTLCW